MTSPWIKRFSEERINVYNLKDASISTINHPVCKQADVDLAVKIANEAFETGPWPTFSGAQRRACLNKLADLLEENVDEAAQLIMEIPWIARVFRYYARWCDKLEGESYTDDHGFYKIVRHEPIGVWFPPRVFQIVTGDGGTGALLSSHIDIHKVSFTDSIPIGQKILGAANRSNMKRVTLELGGKSPALVFEDADLPKAIDGAYVQEEVAERLIAGIKANFEKIAEGLGSDPQSQGTIFGPVVDRAQYENIHAIIEQGKKEATLVTGGYRFDGEGFFVPPTLFVNPQPEARIYKEEIFGPAVCVRTFKTEDEAVAMANDSRCGLAAYIFTETTRRTLRIAKRLRAGTVGVNAISQLFPQTPFGGYKQSGQGRGLGKYALYDFTEPKTIFIR
ncbi:ALDH-like protein [Lepidopterella palustris CBS 459.81]|uniref:aldehyde dehydrogenase (NAD(+)) n=1 Tax=Lepidopterella palustris CBS 459.81 TaxID=1314670 RepID=A0A8E2E8H3_9PEZI|nr:ALDH-like protein [Lepidopterella palustris CBS 459.81]